VPLSPVLNSDIYDDYFFYAITIPLHFDFRFREFLLDNHGYSKTCQCASVRWLSLKTGPARPGYVKIAIDVTAVDVDLFFFTLPVQ